MSKTSKNIIIIGVTLLFIALIAIYAVVRTHQNKIPEGTIGNTAGNLNNNGLFCESDGVVYFANSYDDDCLYKMNPDQTGIEEVYNLSVKYINAGGDYLFFYGKSAASSTGLGAMVAKPAMLRVKKNGLDMTAMSKNSTGCLLLVDNTLYYQNYTEETGTTFYKMNVWKHDPTELLDYMINPACYYNGSFYYNGMYDDSHLYTYNTATNTETTIWEGEVWNPIYDGEYVYYMDIRNNYRLCRYSFSSNTIEVITEDRVDCFNMYGGIIYYEKSASDDYGLYRINTDGSNKELVMKGVYNSINITSTYTYFRDFNSDYITYCTPTFGGVNVTEFAAAKDALKIKK